MTRNGPEIHNLSFKVGDPKQLPATVLSSVASKFLYECSMFERLQRAGHPVIMLTEQVK
jgi:superfamily I DNA and/or RNA helicase